MVEISGLALTIVPVVITSVYILACSNKYNEVVSSLKNGNSVSRKVLEEKMPLDEHYARSGNGGTFAFIIAILISVVATNQIGNISHTLWAFVSAFLTYGYYESSSKYAIIHAMNEKLNTEPYYEQHKKKIIETKKYIMALFVACIVYYIMASIYQGLGSEFGQRQTIVFIIVMVIHIYTIVPVITRK